MAPAMLALRETNCDHEWHVFHIAETIPMKNSLEYYYRRRRALSSRQILRNRAKPVDCLALVVACSEKDNSCLKEQPDYLLIKLHYSICYSSSVIHFPVFLVRATTRGVPSLLLPRVDR